MISCGNFAVSIFFFIFRSSASAIEEYMPLYLRQQGLSAGLIGMVPMLGLLAQTAFVPLIGFLADKFRVRKLVLIIAIVAIVPTTLLFAVPQYPQQPCHSLERNLTDGNSTSSISDHASINIAVNRLNQTGIYHSFTKQTPSTANNVSSKGFLVSPTRLLLLGPTATSEDEQYKRKATYMIIIVLLRGVYELLKRVITAMITVATITASKEDKTKYGYYACWGQLGAGLSLFLIGITVSHVVHYICNVPAPGYILSFFYAAFFEALTLIPSFWLKFEYLEHRVVNYAEVKEVLFDYHYLFLLVICCHGGLCTSFQTRWEFWYIGELNGSPLAMAVGGLVRRPIVGIWFLLSRHIITRLGELNVIAIALFLFAASFAGLAFIGNPWMVIVLDNFQSCAYVLIFSSIVVHFAKAGSKASSAFIQGVVTLMYMGIGKELGAALLGWLFTTQGTRIALCCYSATTLFFFVVWVVYIFLAKDLDGYTKLATEDSEDVEEK